VQLQPSPSETLELTAVFDKSLAFYVWQPIWHTTRILAGSATDTLDIRALWTAAADILADEPCWTVLRLNSQTALSRYVAIEPIEKPPDNIWITDGDMGSPGWLAVLLTAATVMRMLLNICDVPSLGTCTELAATELMGKIQQISLGQISTQVDTKQLPSAQLKHSERHCCSSSQRVCSQARRHKCQASPYGQLQHYHASRLASMAETPLQGRELLKPPKC